MEARQLSARRAWDWPKRDGINGPSPTRSPRRCALGCAPWHSNARRSARRALRDCCNASWGLSIKSGWSDSTPRKACSCHVVPGVDAGARCVYYRPGRVLGAPLSRKLRGCEPVPIVYGAGVWCRFHCTPMQLKTLLSAADVAVRQTSVDTGRNAVNLCVLGQAC